MKSVSDSKGSSESSVGGGKLGVSRRFLQYSRAENSIKETCVLF